MALIASRLRPEAKFTDTGDGAEGIVWCIWQKQGSFENGHAFLLLEYIVEGPPRVVTRGKTDRSNLVTKQAAQSHRFCVWHLHTGSAPTVETSASQQFSACWCRRTYHLNGTTYSGQDVWRRTIVNGNAGQIPGNIVLNMGRGPAECHAPNGQTEAQQMAWLLEHAKTCNCLDDHPNHFRQGGSKIFYSMGAVISRAKALEIQASCEAVAFGEENQRDAITGGCESFQRWGGGWTIKHQGQPRASTNCITAVYDLLGHHGISFNWLGYLASFISPSTAVWGGKLVGTGVKKSIVNDWITESVAAE